SDPIRNWSTDSRRVFVVGATVELATETRLPNASPLLEEERNPRGLALLANGNHPFLFQRTRTGAALTTDDGPLDATQIELAQTLKQWLDGEKANRSGSISQMSDAGHAVFAIFDAYTPPDVPLARREPKSPS